MRLPLAGLRPEGAKLRTAGGAFGVHAFRREPSYRQPSEPHAADGEGAAPEGGQKSLLKLRIGLTNEAATAHAVGLKLAARPVGRRRCPRQRKEQGGVPPGVPPDAAAQSPVCRLRPRGGALRLTQSGLGARRLGFPLLWHPAPAWWPRPPEGPRLVAQDAAAARRTSP